LFGRIDTLIDERDEWFDVQMSSLLDYLGVPERAARPVRSITADGYTRV